MTNDALGYMLAIISLVLSIMGYNLKRPAIGFAGAGMWIIFALFSYSLSTAVWDIYFGIFWVGIALSIVIGLETFVLRPKLKDDELYNALDHDSWEDYGEKMEKYRDGLDRARRPTNRERRIRKMK